ncbi:MmcQ/YjbR family DNA-binding protein [uncultured Tateyamaria sp.]|uniref:MmcQ/YjbR family DNA-binding protein n=1 Tax=uncultured Tateyamaria sp. TaxID=455651 RepID=UPI002627C1E4|nr:MmcQ/YjbR family DNA-binding protein [uncultured Tateyamaria sp.]
MATSRHSVPMSRETVDMICAALPGAHWASHHEGGLDAWKVGDKMFACIGIANDGVSVKCADVDSAQFLIEIGAATKAKYFHRSWVRIPFDGKDASEMQDRILTSYKIIRASLPKKLQATLAPTPSAD